MHNQSSPSPAEAHRFVVLATCCLSLFLVTMDVTIVNVALPSIRRELQAGVAGLQWAVDGYTVVIACLLLLSGSTADRFGRRRTFQVGLAVFGLGSLLCSLAPTTGALVAFRMVQAVGGSMMNPVAMSIIVNTFTDPRERARAIGIWGGVFGVSMAAGPLLGGVLVEHVGWRSVFWINVPVVALAVGLTAKYVPESSGTPRRFDFVGQVLVMAGLFALTSAVIEGRRIGWSAWPITAGFVLAASCAMGLVRWETRHEEPLLDMRFFRSVPFSSATLLAVLGFAAFSGFLFLNSLYLQEARALPASSAGLMTLPAALALAVCAPISGRLAGAGRSRLAIVTAGVALTLGALVLTRLARETPLPVLIAAYALFGIGMGTINAPITNTAVSGMPRTQAGTAAAVASTSRQVGASLGVAFAGALAGTGLDTARGDLSASTHLVFWAIAALGIAIVIVGFASTGARARASADRVAGLFTTAVRP
jgi:EmrB/QacA subfamily drug resistance transporter